MADTNSSDTSNKTPRKRVAASASDINVGTGSPASSGTATSSGATGTFAKVKAQAAGLVDEAAEVARNAATQGKDKAADALGGLSRLAEDAAKAVDDRLGGNYGDYARRASTSVSDFATSLQGKDVDAIIADTKAFVRKSPVVALGAAAAVGFLLTRLVKIGSTDRDA
ncbi:hypothetical protein [Sphingomonas sp.]|uniref:hypothetical protein n=1 Tax=Sphingomonas sp. TaxID=28214 RepID=UPI0025D08C87|nr:hypothetical protein [Sphingomonas sp.]